MAKVKSLSIFITETNKSGKVSNHCDYLFKIQRKGLLFENLLTIQYSTQHSNQLNRM